jgi:integrase
MRPAVSAQGAPSPGGMSEPREAAMRIPTPEQVGALLAARDDRFRVYAVCAFAGLRRGEASALQVGDVDFLKRRIFVSRQYNRPMAVPSNLPPKRRRRTTRAPISGPLRRTGQGPARRQ